MDQEAAQAGVAPREYAQGPSEGPRRRGVEHERLDVFSGAWVSEGTLGTGGQPAGGKATTEEEYEWLPGEFFLYHRGVMRFGEQSLESTAILGFDSATRSYRLHQFDNFGYARIDEGQVTGDVWTFKGVHERVTYTFERDSAELRIVWEQSKDGREWENLCDLKAHRAH